NLANLPAYLDIGASFDHDAREIGLMPDYHAHYLSELALRHRRKPLIADQRLWSGETATPAAIAA
ncbi:MAG TPA: hypothetical protein PLS69_01465, partial [Terricaulis sp.]|nr:hypothetical protein [Terricaulis sp.]